MKPAPEGQPTSSVKRFLDHAKGDLAEWQFEVAYAKRRLALAERSVERVTGEVELYTYQLGLRLEQGRDD
jgi:hypothetical protein